MSYLRLNLLRQFIRTPVVLQTNVPSVFFSSASNPKQAKKKDADAETNFTEQRSRQRHEVGAAKDTVGRVKPEDYNIEDPPNIKGDVYIKKADPTQKKPDPR
eukprot:TRINITY_DN18663_c0_g1_i1.p1 TRINITY_DN18663_c0_g1~~TRINITY_DN18663_c0_g1_i1.p1  ORF type:complete len:102 (+),score=15.00 TRINITY_DN18663_c0_g1_i1:124-429(+)